ncbi:MAG: divalent-cation tolerance protein CutA [Gemmataceae bacterium]|nr:divalent-cation tolerance protein CutA [Gemmataceae bacterium]
MTDANLLWLMEAAMERPVLVYTTYPSLVEAERAGRLLVEQGLAACVNILPGMRSIYRWQGAVESAEEAVMIVKTRASQKEAVEAVVKRLHSYHTPAILFLPTEGGSAEYIGWILSESGGEKIES